MVFLFLQKAYFSIWCTVYTTTVILFLCKRSWGVLPRLYVKIILAFQRCLPCNRAMEEENNNRIFKFIEKKHLTPQNIQKEGTNREVFDVGVDLLVTGVGAIIQDDIERPFEFAPLNGWTLLTLPSVSTQTLADLVYHALYFAGFVFRWTFLLPLRMAFVATAAIFIVFAAPWANIFKATEKQKMFISITFCRLFSAAFGIVADVRGLKDRPKRGGISVSNHMTANDIQTLLALCSYDGIGYSLTGQIHGGIIGPIQSYATTLTPTLWLDRADQNQRHVFQKKVIDYASDESVYPVLLFPEGFCTNCEAVMQFRRAVFTGEVPIFPIAFRQDARLGDLFWKEDTYLPYMIRVMTNWATSLEVTYLPMMEKYPEETPGDFAQRVQCKIALAAGIDAIPYDASLKRQKDRVRYMQKLQDSLFSCLS